MRYAIKLLLLSLALVSATGAQSNEITGQWTEPTGSVIRIDSCGPHICMWLDAIGPKAPSNFDIHNPDPAKRKRSLCGLQIGNGFAPRSPVEAGDGKLYDPKSGKTYHGQMKLNGNRLELRGYVGFPLFGETQIWARPVAPVSACTSSGEHK
jgi:uncharacterized protein (DUF2147 family)